VIAVSDRPEHSLLTTGYGPAKLSVCALRDLRGHSPEESGGMWAVKIARTTLRDALQTGDGEGDASTLANALDSAAFDSDELIIARWPDSEALARARMDDLAAALTPDEIPQPIELLQARRNAVMRRDMLAHYGYYIAEELADMHGSTAKNRYALATRWSRDGRVFSVPLGTRSVFPAFQFDADGQPYPIVGETLAALPRDDMSAWGVGLWFYAHNVWLPGEARPADLIGGREQALVAEAARRLTEPEPL
jgi:hypothetical protein